MLRRLLPPAVLLVGGLLLMSTPPTPDGSAVERALVPRTGREPDAPPRLVGRYRPVTPAAGRCRASRPGTRASPRAEASAGAPDRAPQGVGFVAGRVRFPDGTPAAFVTVEASTLAPSHPTPDPAPVPGLTRCTTTTDAEGRFRAEGLRPGPIRVEAPGASVRTSAGTDDAALVVRRHRVRIRVLDPAGRPLAGADVGVRYVVDGRCPIDRCTVRPDDASRDLWLEPGAHVIVAGHLDGHTVAERDVVVPDHPWSQTVDLVLVPHGRETGWLRVHLADETGRPLAPPDVVLASPRARSLLARDGPTRHAGTDGVVRDLPPGTYCVYVHPVDGPGDEASRYCFVQHPEVTIRPASETRLDLRTVTGGRLLLGEWCDAPLARRDLEARVRFERPGVAEERTLWLDPDDSDESMLLEPGAWTMVVYGEGVLETRRTVLVEAGTTRVETVDLRVP